MLRHTDNYSAKIPSCIPDGEYLLRIHSLGIHNPWPAGIPQVSSHHPEYQPERCSQLWQFYISCAHVNVTGGGSTAPSNAVKIPGVFKDSDPGYTVNVSFWDWLSDYSFVTANTRATRSTSQDSTRIPLLEARCSRANCKLVIEL